MSDVSTWYHSLPFFTRNLLTLSLIFPLLGRFGLINPSYLVLLYEPFLLRFQIWRPITSMFYYPITPQTGFHYLMNLYFLYSYSIRLETGIFNGKPADYCFMLLFLWICSVSAGLILHIMMLMDVMVLAILHTWCQLNKDVIVSFWFGTQFKAAFLPWVLLIFKLILGGSFLTELVGIVIGHLYYFLKFKYPQDFDGPALLETPSILYHYFPNQQVISGFGFTWPQPTLQRTANNERRYNWGQGQALGGN